VEVTLTKISDERHAVTVTRRDGSTERVELNTRSFLRHDLAHFTVELELGLTAGVWGSVAAGGSLAGDGLDGDDMGLAETLAGPVQTMMRIEADAATIRSVLDQVAPQVASDDLAARIHERLRRLRGHWKATPYGGNMCLTWPDPT
jgi:hypothetical protein